MTEAQHWSGRTMCGSSQRPANLPRRSGLCHTDTGGSVPGAVVSMPETSVSTVRANRQDRDPRYPPRRTPPV
jgi:hypothetical protein